MVNKAEHMKGNKGVHESDQEIGVGQAVGFQEVKHKLECPSLQWSCLPLAG